MMPEHLRSLAASGRGHRVNGVVEGDTVALQAWLTAISPPGVRGMRQVLSGGALNLDGANPAIWPIIL